eukprot:jgi/Psemu1/16964/gm1.16964_g
MNTPDLASLFPSFDPALATFLHDSFDVPKESHSTLCKALINARYKTWSAFLHIEYIHDLEYHDGSARVPLTRHIQLKLQRFIDFGRHLTEQGLDWEERDHYTKKAFKDYCQGIVQARRDSAVTNRATISTDGHGWPPKPIAQLQYESWIRKPRDATTFPVLQTDATFEHWFVQFKAQLDANGINPTTFLDPYWPDHVLTGYPKALHDEQCAFFWTLLRHVFQGAFSSSCVLYHQRTRDGRQAYFDFVKLHKPVSHPMPPAAPVSSPGPVPVRPPAVGNIVPPRPTSPVSTHAAVHSTISTPAVHNSPTTTACKTPDHPTVDNPKTPTGLPRNPNPGSNDDSTSIGTSSYTWKYFPNTDSMIHLSAIASHIPLTPELPIHLPPTLDGHFILNNVVSSSVTKPPLYGSRKPLYGASFSSAWKPSAYPVGKPLYEAHSMTYVLPAVCITKRHRDAIKIKLYQLHATLLIANWLYDNVP